MLPKLKKKRYWLGILLVLVLAVYMFLPFILSSAPVTRMIVSGINKKTPGTLHIGSLLIDWQQGFLCQDFVYEDRLRNIRITIPRLTSTQGLAELILAPRNLGLIAMDTPVLEFTPTTSPPGDSSGPTRRLAPDRAHKTDWEKFKGQLQVRDGSIEIMANGGQPAAGVKNVTLHSILSEGEVEYDLQCRAMGDQGEFAAKGRLNLPAGEKNILATLYSEAEVSIRGWQIRNYLSFAAHYFDVPVGEGVLTADMRLASAGLEDFELSGSAEVGDLKLAGGMLGEDTPSFEKISLTLEEGEWSKIYRRVKGMQLESDAGSLSFSGEYKDKRMQMNSRGNLSIPVLFDRFPHLLKVREEAFIESGVLDISADMDVDGQKGSFDFMARMDNLGGLFNGRPFTWDTPITAILHGENEGFDIRVQRLQVESPFLHALGQGDITAFELEASADLGQTLAEFGKLFQHSWTGSGDLELLMKAAAAGTDNLYTVDTDLNISGFSLSRQETVVVPNQHFSIVGNASVPFSLLRDRQGVFDLQFALSSWLGEVFFAMNGDRKKEGLRDTHYSTDTNLQLDSLTRLLHALDFVPPETEIGGDLQVQAAGYIEGTLVGIDDFTGRIHDFAFRENGTGFSDPEIRLYTNRPVNDEIPSLVIHELKLADSREAFLTTGAGTNGIDVAAFSLFFHDIGLDAGLGNLQLEELVLGDWRKPFATVRAQGVMNADLHMLVQLLQPLSLPTDDLDLAGAGHLVFSAADRGEGGRDIGADLRIDGFSVSTGDTSLLPADDLMLSLRLEGGPLPGTMAIRDLQLRSAPLDLNAGGKAAFLATERDVELRGTMTPKLDMLAGMLKDALAAEISLAGRNSSEFAVHCRWPANGVTDGDWPLVSLSAGLQADRVEYKGMHFSDLRIPVSMAGKKVQAEVQGRLNKGSVDVSAVSDFSMDPATVRVPEHSRILTDIELDKPLMEGILQDIHPLFGVLAAPAGRLNVTLDSFAWPVKEGGADEADFTAVFDVNRLNLDSSGFLRSILAGFALEEEKLQLRDTRISCSGSKSRITCTPVRILAANSEMVLHGSVGMDKSLEYVLEVPVTEKLVSREVYAFLEGATVKVPITGTVGNPVFDKKAITAAIRDLVKEAVVKVVERQAEKLLPNLIQGDDGQPQKQ